MTTSIASQSTIKGNFTSPGNEYFYRPEVKVVLEKRNSSYFQVAFQNDSEKRASRFDIVVGSGRKAQTYLYWDDSAIFQLPVSWSVAANDWVNSPNYPPHQVRFDRNIPVGCFECHGSYIKVTSNSVSATNNHVIDNFDRNSLITGIDCERCHGPAAAHVLFHQRNPQDKHPGYITSYKTLQRQQQIDLCAQCHSGIHLSVRSVFTFRPGNTLDNQFFAHSDPVKDITEVDVHGSQTQLLEASKCFMKSSGMTCTTCHNTHATERDNMTVFSQRCMTCHETSKHTTNINVNNCIDCHMPALPSRLISFLSNGKPAPSPNFVRTHLITVYPDSILQSARHSKIN
jgi:hypothetical protein